MKLKLIFAIILIILLIGCKKEPVEEKPIAVPDEQVEEPQISEVIVEQAIVDVMLTVDRRMEPAELSIPAGTTVKWTNEGDMPRNLMIYDASIGDLKEEDIVRSQNIYANRSFSYTFNETGEYIVRDIYMYSMRGRVIVESS